MKCTKVHSFYNFLRCINDLLNRFSMWKTSWIVEEELRRCQLLRISSSSTYWGEREIQSACRIWFPLDYFSFISHTTIEIMHNSCSEFRVSHCRLRRWSTIVKGEGTTNEDDNGRGNRNEKSESVSNDYLKVEFILNESRFGFDHEKVKNKSSLA